MLTLMLYKNLDPLQPIPFDGRMLEDVRCKLWYWLNIHSGEHPGSQAGADGICVFLEEDGRESVDTPVISLTFDESDTPGWNVQNRHDLDDGMSWEDARDKFIDLAIIHGEWTRVTESWWE